MENVTNIVCSFYGVSPKSICLKGRNTNREAIAKQMAAYLIKELVPEASARKLGKYFNRHFTTIILGWKAIRNELDVCRKRKEEYETLKLKIISIEKY